MSITRISAATLALLEARLPLAVHSVFDGAVNLRCGRDLVTCTARSLSAPHGIEMSPDDLRRLREHARRRPDAALRWDPARRVLGDASPGLELGLAPGLVVFDPALPSSDPSVFAAAATGLVDHLARRRPPTGFGDDWAALSTDERFDDAIGALVAGHVDDAVLAVLGLGPGLTPSGDDVLVGALAAAHSIGALGPEAAARLGPSLERAARRRTTEISVEYLRCACRGLAAGPLRDLIHALGRGDVDAMTQAVRRLRAYGHTSGMDSTLGVVAAARLLAPAHAVIDSGSVAQSRSGT